MTSEIVPPQRQPNGRRARALSRFQERQAAKTWDGPSPAALKRALDNNLLTVNNPIWGKPAGIMTVQGKLTIKHLAAAGYWDALAAAYRKAIASSSPDPKAATLGQGSHSFAIDPDSERGQREAVTHRYAIRAFEAALGAIRLVDPAAEKILRECCEGAGRHVVGYYEEMILRRALEAVNSARGLTGAKSHVR